MASTDTSIKREREEVVDGLLGSFHETPSDAQKPKKDEDDKKGQRWTPEQDEALRQAVEKYGQRNWKSIATEVEGRNHAQCLQRWNKVLKPGLVKGHWSFEEDAILERMVRQGCHSWAEVSAHIPGRTAKQCRERWRNHLDPSISKSPFTPEEDMTIQQAFEQMGNRWTQIAELLPGRTEDAVKMRWKALNPNAKTNAKPGRPRLMQNSGGATSTNKSRATAPPNPDLMIASAMMPPVPMQPMYAYPMAYDPSLSIPMGTMPLGVMPPLEQQASMPPPQLPQDQVSYPEPLHVGSEFPEPNVEPLGDDHHFDVDPNDAAILKELLRSHSNSLLSLGSARGFSSFADMSPDELLASGELDEMLKAVSLANEGTGTSFSSGAKSSFRMSGSFSSSRSLAKALESLGSSQDKHIFQELIDELRSNPTEVNQQLQGTADDSHLYTLPESFEFGHSNLDSTKIDPLAHDGDDDDDDDDDDFADLMKPIHRSKRY